MPALLQSLGVVRAGMIARLHCMHYQQHGGGCSRACSWPTRCLTMPCTCARAHVCTRWAGTQLQPFCSLVWWLLHGGFAWPACAGLELDSPSCARQAHLRQQSHPPTHAHGAAGSVETVAGSGHGHNKAWRCGHTHTHACMHACMQMEKRRSRLGVRVHAAWWERARHVLQPAWQSCWLAQ